MGGVPSSRSRQLQRRGTRRRGRGRARSSAARCSGGQPTEAITATIGTPSSVCPAQTAPHWPLASSAVSPVGSMVTRMSTPTHEAPARVPVKRALPRRSPRCHRSRLIAPAGTCAMESAAARSVQRRCRRGGCGASRCKPQSHETHTPHQTPHQNASRLRRVGGGGGGSKGSATGTASAGAASAEEAAHPSAAPFPASVPARLTAGPCCFERSLARNRIDPARVSDHHIRTGTAGSRLGHAALMGFSCAIHSGVRPAFVDCD